MPPTDLTHAEAWEIAAWIAAKQVSPVEVAGHFLDRIAMYDGELGAFITVVAEQAMAAAHRAEQAVIAGDEIGPLHGVPIGIKDLEATKGIRTTYGSILMHEYIPEHDEISVERLRNAGAVIVGKTNTPEYGWKGTTENLLHGPAHNPWDTKRTAGGSSGGSATAVAAGLVPIASGSDAGGSIRIPASFCGVFGIKPTHGRVAANYRRAAGWRPLSQHGPLTRTTKDAALLLEVMAGPDDRDPTAIRTPTPDFTGAVESASVDGLRIAWSPDLDGRPVDREVRAHTAEAATLLDALGADVEEAAPELNTDEAVWLFVTLMYTELALVLGPVVEAGHGAALPPTLLQWVQEAVDMPATRYARGMHELLWHRRRFEQFFETHDLLITPTLAVPAFPLEQNPSRIDGRDVDHWWGFTPFCFHANLTGQPAASVPFGVSADGLPIGVQITGRMGEETTVLRAAAAIEQARPWVDRWPARFA